MAPRNPKSHLIYRCLLGTGDFVILRRSSPSSGGLLRAMALRCGGCVHVGVYWPEMYVGKKRIYFSWNASTMYVGEIQRLEEQKDSG